MKPNNLILSPAVGPVQTGRTPGPLAQPSGSRVGAREADSRRGGWRLGAVSRPGRVPLGGASGSSPLPCASPLPVRPLPYKARVGEGRGRTIVLGRPGAVTRTHSSDSALLACPIPRNLLKTLLDSDLTQYMTKVISLKIASTHAAIPVGSQCAYAHDRQPLPTIGRRFATLPSSLSTSSPCPGLVPSSFAPSPCPRRRPSWS